MNTCKWCGGEFPKSGKPGRPRTACDDCFPRQASLRTRAWQKANPDREKATRQRTFKRYYDKNRRQQIEKATQYQRAHPDARKTNNRRYYDRHPEKWLEARLRRAEVRNTAKADKWCAWCGTLLPRTLRSDAMYCPNNSCKKRAHDKAIALRREVAERDGWICQLCYEPIDRAAKGPRSLEVDHRTARSRGGSDDLENLQAAHMSCNRSKGGRAQKVTDVSPAGPVGAAM
jgi:5-methylcytosine-specific restriction endonuclease McrA